MDADDGGGEGRNKCGKPTAAWGWRVRLQNIKLNWKATQAQGKDFTAMAAIGTLALALAMAGRDGEWVVASGCAPSSLPFGQRQRQQEQA